MTKRQLLTELQTATTAQIDKGIKQLEALLAENEEYHFCFTKHKPASTREEQDKNDFFHDFSFFIGCTYINLITTYTEDDRYCYYSKQFRVSSRPTSVLELKNLYDILKEK